MTVLPFPVAIERKSQVLYSIFTETVAWSEEEETGTDLDRRTRRIADGIARARYPQTIEPPLVFG